ncbi:STAS domain-containing protein [Thiocapsa sp.]|uniref:STAS domain-containing protein n=1 Tax=Thiocapsa sp. TaxID=2024551 RepID=UPI002B6EEEEF|nr:STAS domain-containing protein [Thiocapsa sp.]HSO82066.1 STAS domain-containing protein [Thiocapsa sp.]
MKEARLTPLGEGRYALGGVLDFSTVNRVAVAGVTLFKRDALVDIDLAGVESANSAGLALLLEWLDLARARGARLTYRNLPDSLVRIAAVSNLAALLPMETAIGR